MLTTISLSFPEHDIAQLTLDMPDKGTNVLSRSVLEELQERLNQLEQRNDLVGLIVTSGKPSQFIAGADLREFAASLDIDKSQTMKFCTQGQGLFRRLSQGPYLSVAAIDGICVGGGAELASWCDRRIVSDNPKTQIGFPEVKLGLFPGWGGTARLPRVVGLSNAVELITAGESISAREAYKMAWASDIVPAERLIPAAIQLIRCEQQTRDFLCDRARWNGAIDIDENELTFLGAIGSSYIQQHTKGQYPAPVAALETMLEGAITDCDSALQLEAEGMAELFGSPINASLLNIFFLTDRNKKDTGVEEGSRLQPVEIRSVSVVGAGIMGAGIAAANVKQKRAVLLSDTRDDALRRGIAHVLEEVSYNRETKGADVQRTIEFAPFINGVNNDAELAASDLVLEAVIENEDVKRQLYSTLEPQMRPDAILATNTSTIPITTLASGLRQPERFCGIHFFNPVRKMQLVEVIRGSQTSDQTVVTAVAFAKSLKKMPVVVNDGPGFLVNRLLFPYMGEALHLIEEGVPIADIEKAATKFGMPMGPIALYDMVGLDTALYAGKVLCDAFSDRFSGSAILPALVETGRLGQKSGSGFYAYTDRKKKGVVDPTLEPLLKPFVTGKQKLSRDEITDRLILPMLVESSRILEEELVRDARDIDLGMIFGTGFPPFKGGPLFWADSVGIAKMVEKMKPYEELGKRYQPTAQLQLLARRGDRLYG